MSLFQNLVALLAAIQAGDLGKIWVALKAILDQVLTHSGPAPATMAASEAAAVVGCTPTECEDCCHKIRVACESTLGVSVKPGAPVGAWGDGTLLKNFSQIILQLLPFILAFVRPTPIPVVPPTPVAEAQ